jgi:hypothetical protein
VAPTAPFDATHPESGAVHRFILLLILGQIMLAVLSPPRRAEAPTHPRCRRAGATSGHFTFAADKI